MPKQKTHSGAKKRFKLTKNGLVKYQKTNKRHRLTQKDHKRKRIARNMGVVPQTQLLSESLCLTNNRRHRRYISEDSIIHLEV